MEQAPHETVCLNIELFDCLWDDVTKCENYVMIEKDRHLG